jgi:transcriptional regulator with XRE-family HTH domain
MRRDTEPEALRLALIVLRSLRGWTQSELAAAAETAPSVLSEYESGRRKLTPRTLERMATVVGAPSSALAALLPALSALVEAAEAPSPGLASSLRSQAMAEGVGGPLGSLLRSAGRALRQGQEGTPAPPMPEDREKAQALWGRLERLTAQDRRLLVEEATEFRSWALSERLCQESLKAAAQSTETALELAELALRVAELAPGGDAWRWRLQGHAWAFVGKARRARGDLAGAREAFARFHELWPAGAAADPGLLAEPEVPQAVSFSKSE